MEITANDILKLLDQKYPVEKFLTVPECKIGSTWFKKMCSRFDIWVMARSWAHPRFIGCEIKVSRSDFLNDNKWQNYLPYCSEFYFASPPDIINPGEVPEQAGLMICTKNCKRLITKKKAPVRDIEIPNSILVYILMCRTRITADTTSKANLWECRLKEMRAEKQLGRDVAYHIRSLVDKQVKEVRGENAKLKRENKRLQFVKEVMSELGIENEVYMPRIKRNISEALSGIPYDLPEYLREIKMNVGRALKALGVSQ